jgi:hypothetical protein
MTEPLHPFFFFFFFFSSERRKKGEWKEVRMKEGSKKVEEEVGAKQKEMQDAGPVNRLDHVTNSTKKKKHRHGGPGSLAPAQ